MIKAIIVEDELNSRELLRTLVERFCLEVEVVGMAGNAQEGIALAQNMKPDLVFLDIEMPGGDGFEVLKAFDPIPFKVIFVTGYDQYAIQAIRFSALDYLLKPVDVKELKTAVDKVSKHKNIDHAHIQNVEWNLKKESNQAGRIILSSGKERILFDLDEVLFLEAQREYVNFVLEGSRKQIAAYSLGYYEKLLPPSQFFRTHKSYIVNCQKVVSINKGRGGVVQLKDGSSVPIAFRRKSSFVQLLGLKP